MIDSSNRMRMYGLLVTVVIVVLLLAQIILLRSFAQRSNEYALIKDGIASSRSEAGAKATLLNEYKTLKDSDSKEKISPESALALYTVVDKALNDNGIEHTNKSSSTALGTPPPSPDGTVDWGPLQIEIDFKGSYYGLLKALAALRDGSCLMRISSFRIRGEDDGKVSGSMTVVSVTKS